MRAGTAVSKHEIAAMPPQEVAAKLGEIVDADVLPQTKVYRASLPLRVAAAVRMRPSDGSTEQPNRVLKYLSIDVALIDGGAAAIPPRKPDDLRSGSFGTGRQLSFE
ncbi:hypothetical protein QFZ79_000089 [Arthrobacter sp. V4I6]|nr:hypothetical protein [Arthrobacter sp. V1I7]MDQ0851978.1 hypothetical protein [Arthrobacter sp. V4I6]